MKLNNICKIYHNKNNDVQALKDINIHISEKGMTFILGPSGSGKTTLFNRIIRYKVFNFSKYSTAFLYLFIFT